MKDKYGLKGFLKHYGFKILAVCFWLLLWELLSIWIGHEILLAAPTAVLVTLIGLVGSLDFWQTILFSSLRIILGFLLALFVGSILAICAHNSRPIKELIAPLMKTIQAMPVASFIILALIWIKAKNLSVLASFLMVMPLIYSNVSQGLKATDEKLLQMAKVFQISRSKKIIAIYIPSVLPYFISAVSVGVGLCWKAGIAAEVIGIPTGSIGEKLYEAKLYLMTKELFAWTIVIIIISIIFEKAVMMMLQLFKKDNETQKQRKTAEE
ncbi:MAG: ABC transporter permease subunit [Herbinix sp.]|nr:ABC transporter permease subunit [Herbinix sp.]